MNSTSKQYQPFMMAEERAARSVFGKLRDGESCHISEHANRSGPASGKMRTCGHSDLRIVEPVNCGRNLRTKSADRRVKCGSADFFCGTWAKFQRS